ncbi:hypothetical protein LSTR_LSTR003567, partial [Laodelphax striatellus]
LHSVKLDFNTEVNDLSLEDDSFLEVVREDIKQFLSASEDVKRVLLFPPLNSRRRFLIHNFIQENFKKHNLRTFSVGQNSQRRTAVCHASIIIEGKLADTCAKEQCAIVGSSRCSDGKMAATVVPTNQSGGRSRPARVAPSLNLYQPPAVRAAELKQTQSAACVAASPGSRASARPRDNSKDDRRNKRPDQQRYVPRPLRSESGSSAAAGAHKSETSTDGRRVSTEAPSKSTTRTRHSEIGTASSRVLSIRTTNPTKDPQEISGTVDGNCTKRDKVSEKVCSRPILIRKRYSAPVQSANSSGENSVDGLNSSQKYENNLPSLTQQNSVEYPIDSFHKTENTLQSSESSIGGLNSPKKCDNNHDSLSQENSDEGLNSPQKIENDHRLSSQENSTEEFNNLSEKTVSNHSLSFQENSVDGFNSSQKSENNHSSPNHTLKLSGVENGFKHDETSKDSSIISQVSLETGDSCSNFGTDTNSMTEDHSNQLRLSNGIDSSGEFESETLSTNQDSDATEIDGDRMEIDNSVQCEQVVPNLNTDNQIHSQVCPEIKNSCELREVSSQVIKTECLSSSLGKNPDESSSFSDGNPCSDDKPADKALLQEVQTAKRIRTEEIDDWETLYDDDSALVDPGIIEELGESVGKVKITAASSDYRSYQSVEERSNNGECILEIYGFPAEFKTRDLMTAFAGYRNKAGFNIKWVDDTHALAVFNSPLVADEVLMCDLPFVKTRPLRLGLPESRAKARNLVLPPAVRPKTCPALAKRLVSGALGLRLQTDKKAREHEKLLLKEARDQKRLTAKLREAAWEGTLTSNMQS